MVFSIQYISIIIELIIAILGIMIFFKKKKLYGWGFFLTFAIYVFYDLSKLLGWAVSGNILYAIFFVASLSALYAVWGVYNSK